MPGKTILEIPVAEQEQMLVQLRAARYGHLKRELAERFAHDRAAYTAAKAPFIAAVLADAGFDLP